jgi:hypothetical protein
LLTSCSSMKNDIKKFDEHSIVKNAKYVEMFLIEPDESLDSETRNWGHKITSDVMEITGKTKEKLIHNILTDMETKEVFVCECRFEPMMVFHISDGEKVIELVFPTNGVNIKIYHEGILMHHGKINKTRDFYLKVGMTGFPNNENLEFAKDSHKL